MNYGRRTVKVPKVPKSLGSKVTRFKGPEVHRLGMVMSRSYLNGSLNLNKVQLVFTIL